jgi:hypothetical protein
MTPESVLLVNENFIPEEAVPIYNAGIDFIMLSMFSSHERTVNQWTTLIESAGFSVVKVWRPDTPGAATLFEAKKVLGGGGGVVGGEILEVESG